MNDYKERFKETEALLEAIRQQEITTGHAPHDALIEKAVDDLARRQWSDYLGTIEEVDEYEEAFGIKELLAEGIARLEKTFGRPVVVDKFIDWCPESGDNRLVVRFLSNDRRKERGLDRQFRHDWLYPNRDKMGGVHFRMACGPDHVEYPPEPPREPTGDDDLDYSAPIDADLMKAFGAYVEPAPHPQER